MGEVHDFIQRSYTGGHVDVYKSNAHNLYLYVENSMYPAQMKELMPCGNPTYFEIPENNPVYLDSTRPWYLTSFTNHLKINSIFDTHPTDLKNRPYGFFEVEVETPDGDELNYLMLQTRLKTYDGMRTVAACGNWPGVYSTTELYFAMDAYNYRFKVLRGVVFPQTVIFSEFIKHFYNIKSNTP